MRKAFLVLFLALAFTTTGCISYVTPVGNILDLDQVDMTTDFKTGESCGWVVFSVIGPFGDVSVVKAAQQGGVRQIDVVDYRIENYVVVQRTCAFVYGR